ncbi:sensor histidine kinase [Aquabacterium sp. J223]|uniref:sensor histidine kinase n=1 Tax=Aquabacterium sp. J223 TaxID=2898431 RepID=UPI0021AD6E4A|nr:PAS domain S-box protein [Aquabacterium sp. J223]UUX96252.1 PAS domain S-box protein [Aquabacterium sp. J223]
MTRPEADTGWRDTLLRCRAVWAVVADLALQPRPRWVIGAVLLLASAGLVAASVRQGLLIAMAVALVLGLLWTALLLSLSRLAQERRAAVGSVEQLTRSLTPSGRSSRQAFQRSVHASTQPATALLTELSQEVAQVLSDSERRWHARARLSADWYWETDDALRVVWVSEDLKSHVKLGLQPADLLGRRLDEVPFYQPPEGGWAALAERMAQRKSFRNVEIEVLRPGRSVVWTSISGRARHDAAGRFLGYDGIGRDVTEQRLAFKRLRDSERRFALIAELSLDWYWETDAEHRIVSFGARARELLGERALAAIGKPRWEAYAEGALPEAWAAHRADLQSRRAFRELEFRVRTAGGTVWLSVSGEPRLDGEGRFTGYHGMARDITLYKRAERLLINRNAELERLVAQRTAELAQNNRDLEAFSRQLAHELRTPIGHIVGLADLLRARAWERLGQEEREWLTLQGQSARAMSFTVTSLLELARSGTMPVERERVDLSALACAVIAELPWLERRSPVQWHIEPGVLADCSGSLMRVVLLNLLANAAKFTRDVERPEVGFGVRGEGDRRVFYVQDNGAGFDEAQAGALFQPFVRLHDPGEFHGTGLGLSIVRRVVERHGGTVRAHGQPGVGACFEFSLAAAAAPDIAAANTVTDRLAPAPQSGVSPDAASRSAA